MYDAQIDRYNKIAFLQMYDYRNDYTKIITVSLQFFAKRDLLFIIIIMKFRIFVSFVHFICLEISV